MQQIDVLVNNPTGLHVRPASELSRLVKKFSSDVKIEFKGQLLPAKSALSIMAACIEPGSLIKVIAEGEDEEECITAVGDYIKELKE